MHPAHLAQTSWGISSWADFLAAPWYVELILVSVAVIMIGVIGLWIAYAWQDRDKKIRGPALAGTAQILSVKDTGFAFGNWATHQICKIRLRVTVPGREPYDITVRRSFVFPPKPGQTVPVQVGAANPRKVRIEFDHPVTPDQPDSRQLRALGSELRDQLMAALADQGLQMQGSPAGPVPSGAQLLASGQRVPGVLMSFFANGDNTDSTFSRPELRYAPYYQLTVELHIPNLAPMTARNIQPVPPAMVPKLTLGLQLTCAVDPANPSQRFVVDWDAIGH